MYHFLFVGKFILANEYTLKCGAVIITFPDEL